MSTRKPKADPLLSAPNGSFAQSAWLRTLQKQAQAMPAYAIGLPDGKTFLPTNTLAANADFVRTAGARGHLRQAGGLLPALLCLVHWHGEAAFAPMGNYLDTEPPRQPFIRDLLKFLQHAHYVAALDTLLQRLHLAHVRDLTIKQAKLWPLYTLRRLLALHPARNHPAADVFQLLVQEHPQWLPPLHAQLDTDPSDEAAAQRKTLLRLTAPGDTATDAAEAELPALLRQPPWAKGAQAVHLPTLALAPQTEPATVDWSRWDERPAQQPPVQRLLDDYGSTASFTFPINESRRQAWFDTLISLGTHADIQTLRTVGDAHVDNLGRGTFLLAQRCAWPSSLETLLAFLQAQGLADEAQIQALRQAPGVRITGWSRCLQCITLPWQVDVQFRSIAPPNAKALNKSAQWDVGARALCLLGVRPERVRAVQAQGFVQTQDLGGEADTSPYWFTHLAHLDDALALSLLQHPWPKITAGYVRVQENPAATLLRRFGPEHIALVWPALPHERTAEAQALMDIVDWDDLALRLSEKGFALPTVRTYALRWLQAHPATAARALIPAAFGDDAQAAAHARHHLGALARTGHADTLHAQARAYGPQAQAALAQLLQTPPENLLPATLPKLPTWLNLLRLPRLHLRETGHAISLAHLPDALMPLMLSKGGQHYPGMDLLAQALTPASLAALLLGLFEQWLDNGMPAKDRWIFELQGRFGNDATARALAPRIRQWRAGLDRVRAYQGIEALAQIGSDTALMLLHQLSEQKRYGDLQTRAHQALTNMAEQRGLSLEDLADRTIPSLGLDERGHLALDFGPRQFSVRLGPELQAQVLDANGHVLKDLPKPGARDDAQQARQASATWREFKQQAKLIASAQAQRLESAMCAQRRWQPADFLTFFAQHPVMRALAQRLVWGVFDAHNHYQHGLRVAEDGSLADLHDTIVPLPGSSGAESIAAFAAASTADACGANSLRIGLPHPLEIPEAERAAWAQVLHDYEILSPFEQLTRATYTMTEQELTLDHLPRYQGRKLSAGSLLGLENRGWKRHIGDGGAIAGFQKHTPCGHCISLNIEADWFVYGAPPLEESITITSLTLSGPGQTWASLGPIPRSEILRDLERLAWHA